MHTAGGLHSRVGEAQNGIFFEHPLGRPPASVCASRLRSFFSARPISFLREAACLPRFSNLLLPVGAAQSEHSGCGCVAVMPSAGQ
jgi:hypothetical protein